MSKGTIIYIGRFQLPDKDAASHRVMENAKMLSKIGYTVIMIGVNRELNYSKGLTTNSNIYSSIMCWDTPYPKNSYQWVKYYTSYSYFKKISKFYTDVKAVICYNYQAIPFLKIRKYCKKNNIKIISDCTEWFEWDHENLFLGLIKYFDSFIRMRFVNKSVDGLIVVSNYLRDYYRKKNTVIIPTLVPTKFIDSSNIIVNDIPHLIYVGKPFRLNVKIKNRRLCKDRLDLVISYLFNIYKKDISFIFNIYGITLEQYLIAFPNEQEILFLLKDNVIFHGIVPHSKVFDKIHSSDYSILLRDRKRRTMAGFPTKFTESIKCGVPMVTNNTSDIDKYLVEGKNGFLIDININDSSINEFASILSINVDDREKMKKNVITENIFDLDKWIPVLQCFISKIVE